MTDMTILALPGLLGEGLASRQGKAGVGVGVVLHKARNPPGPGEFLCPGDGDEAPHRTKGVGVRGGGRIALYAAASGRVLRERMETRSLPWLEPQVLATVIPALHYRRTTGGSASACRNEPRA